MSNQKTADVVVVAVDPAEAGWVTIPAGERTCILANPYYIKNEDGHGQLPYMVNPPGELRGVPCSAVIVNGPSGLACTNLPSHCGSNSVWLETYAEVKYRTEV